MMSKSIIADRIRDIQGTYHFSFNENYSAKLKQLSDLCIRTVTVDNDQILFTCNSSDKRKKEIIITDLNYEVLTRHTMNEFSDWHLFYVRRYQDKYIVLGNKISDGSTDNYSLKLFTPDFKLIGELEEEIPFFKNKRLVSAINDDQGGIYFCESRTGILYYLDSNGNVSFYEGNFIAPVQLAYFNKTLYIIDFLPTASLQKHRNIFVFQDGVFQEISLTGEAIAYSHNLDCFFVSSVFVEKTIKKYDAQLNLVFTKDFDFSEPSYSPFYITINRNHLLVCTRENHSPIVYDVF